MAPEDGVRRRRRARLLQLPRPVAGPGSGASGSRLRGADPGALLTLPRGSAARTLPGRCPASTPPRCPSLLPPEARPPAPTRPSRGGERSGGAVPGVSCPPVAMRPWGRPCLLLLAGLAVAIALTEAATCE